jgi:hypothetical protein
MAAGTVGAAAEAGGRHPGSNLVLTDANVYLGRPAVPRFFAEPVTVPVLLGEFDRLGVDGGLVTHVTAREHSPRLGNDVVTSALHGQPRLQSCMTLLPPQTRETWAPDELVDQLRTRDARAVRLFPGHGLHRFPLHPRALGDLLAVLERARVLTLVDFDLGRRDEADWPALYSVAEAYPELPLLLIRPGGRSDRGLYPLLTHFPNVLVETGGYWVHRGLEKVAERFGAHRLLFGSGFPYWTMAGAVYHVATAALTDRDRVAVAGGNLRGLLEAVRW